MNRLTALAIAIAIVLVGKYTYHLGIMIQEGTQFLQMNPEYEISLFGFTAVVTGLLLGIIMMASYTSSQKSKT